MLLGLNDAVEVVKSFNLTGGQVVAIVGILAALHAFVCWLKFLSMTKDWDKSPTLLERIGSALIRAGRDGDAGSADK